MSTVTTTPQDMIDAAWHRARIPQQSLRPFSTLCTYLSGNGLCGCFIGCLTDDNCIKNEWEHDTANVLVENGHLVIDCDWDDMRKQRFANQLQKIHDYFPTSEWVWRIYQLARKHSLSTPGSRR